MRIPSWDEIVLDALEGNKIEDFEQAKKDRTAWKEVIPKIYKIHLFGVKITWSMFMSCIILSSIFTLSKVLPSIFGFISSIWSFLG
jgi:hypothetical protein